MTAARTKWSRDKNVSQNESSASVVGLATSILGIGQVRLGRGWGLDSVARVLVRQGGFRSTLLFLLLSLGLSGLLGLVSISFTDSTPAMERALPLRSSPGLRFYITQFRVFNYKEAALPKKYIRDQQQRNLPGEKTWRAGVCWSVYDGGRKSPMWQGRV